MTTTDHQPLTGERLAEIEARANAATPGPWWSDESDLCWRLHGVMGRIPAQAGGFIPEQIVNKQILKAPKKGTTQAEYWPEPADAEFIAHAREDVPALLAEVRGLTARVAELEATPVDWDAQRRRADELEADRDRAREIAVALEQEQANAWIVPKVPLDDNPYVRPRILGNGLIRRDSGDSTPEHTRRFVAQCLAAADEADTQAKETDRA